CRRPAKTSLFPYTTLFRSSLARLDSVRSQLADRTEAMQELSARWEREKAGLNLVGDLKAQLEQLRMQADRAQREGDLTAASKILDRKSTRLNSSHVKTSYA